MRFRNGLPRQCVPQGHLLRGAHWLAMTGFFDSLKGRTCVVRPLYLAGGWQGTPHLYILYNF